MSWDVTLIVTGGMAYAISVPRLVRAMARVRVIANSYSGRGVLTFESISCMPPDANQDANASDNDSHLLQDIHRGYEGGYGGPRVVVPVSKKYPPEIIRFRGL